MPNYAVKATVGAKSERTSALTLAIAFFAVLTNELTVVFLALFYVFSSQRRCADVKERYTSKRTSPIDPLYHHLPRSSREDSL